MGGLSILHWAIVLLVLGVPLWLIFRSRRAGAGAAQAGMFRDLAPLGQWMRWFFYAVSALYLVGFFSRNLAPAPVPESDSNSIDVIAAIDVLVFYASLVFFLRWIYCANVNARSLGASGMRFTPGWSVGWFFVPVANLVMPYQVMREIWQASSNPGNWKGEPVPAKIGAWWGLWWAVTLVSSFESDDPLYARFAVLALEVLLIPLLWIQLQIMNEIQARQMHHRTLSARALPDKSTTGS